MSARVSGVSIASVPPSDSGTYFIRVKRFLPLAGNYCISKRNTTFARMVKSETVFATRMGSTLLLC